MCVLERQRGAIQGRNGVPSPTLATGTALLLTITRIHACTFLTALLLRRRPSSTAAGELAEPRRGYRPSSSKPVTSEGRSVEAHNLHR